MIDPMDLSTRPPVTEPIKQAITDAFAIVPEGKSGALIAIYDVGQQAGRLHFASKRGEHWKVGAWVGMTKDKKVEGSVAIQATW